MACRNNEPIHGVKPQQDKTFAATSTTQSNEEQNRTQRKPHGLLKSYHGVVYQIQWIMIVALQARRQGVDTGFTFRTEEDENDVGKFDDVVWQYMNGLQKKYNFLQCKHKLNLQEKITINELCKKADQDKNPFSLQKYFISYRDQIKTSPKYKDGLIENLIIVTNINLDDAIKNNFKVVRNVNPVLNVIKSKYQTQGYPRCWRIDNSCVNLDIINILKQTYDLIKLANVLAEFIKHQLSFRLPNDLKMYSNALYNNIVDPEKNRLSDNFISGNNLSKQAEFLREAFFQEHFVKERISLNLRNDYTISSPDEFATIFAHLLKSSENKNVVIQRRKAIIKQNIDNLAGFVLIIEDGIKFNYKFWTTCVDELPNESLKIFRSVLRQKLQQFGILNADDSKTAIATKLNAYRFNITDFVTYRKELLDEVSFWDSARNYKGFKNMCSTTNPSKENRDLPNYNLSDIKNNIHDFFDLLVFAVGYSRECISQIVEYDLRADFGYIDNEYIAEAFRSEIAKCLDLAENRFISTTTDVENFFITAKQQINRFVLVGPTLEYRIRSFFHDIKFSKNSNSKFKLRSFITNSTTEQVLNIIAFQSKLSSIKVHQMLESIPKYQYKNQSTIYIFMCLSTVFCLLDLVIQNFEFNCDLLIIECDTKTTTDDEQYLYSEICRILTKSSKKKVVLISGVKDCLVQLFKNNLGVKFKEVVDNRNNFLNLTKSSQDNLWNNTKVVFLGNQVNLTALMIDDIKYLVNADLLYKAIKGEKIEIGVACTGLDKVKDYYINRTFCRRLALEKKVLKVNDIFAISNTNQFEVSKAISSLFSEADEESNLKIREFNEDDPDVYDPIKFIILNNELESNQFNNLCQIYKNYNIHWLHKENKQFIWQQTHGCLSNLHPYLQKDTKEYKEEGGEFTNAVKLKKVTIISAEPGMGKSTVTSNLESLMKYSPDLWIIRINLLHYSTDLKDAVDESFVTKLIYKAAKLQFLANEKYLNLVTNKVTASFQAGKLFLDGQKKILTNLELFEIGIFNHCFNHGRVVILFDGYDEICSFYEKKVIKLLNILNASSVAHIFITTRPYGILNNLENTLREFSYTLKPLNNKERKSFLIRYWKSNQKLTKLNEYRANIFVDELLRRFSEATSDEEKNFVSIPLQLRMLADNFQDVFVEFYHSNVRSLNDVYMAKIKKKLNLVNLYEDFVNIKFEKIRFKEKKPGINTDFTDMRETINRERIKFINDHQKLALYALFKDNLNELLFLNTEHKVLKFHQSVHKLMKNIEDGDDENGIINCVIDSIPIFVHQSYAEYFVAMYLWEKFKAMQITDFKEKFILNLLLNNIFTGKHLQICRFFYYSAEKDLKDNVNFCHKDDKIIALLESIVNIITTIYLLYKNTGGGCENGTDDITSKHFDNVKFSIYKTSFEIKDIGDEYVHCIKLLFRIVECYLSGTAPKNNEIAAIIEKDKTINLLCMSAEVGCLNFIKLFVISKQIDYEKELLKTKWYFTPFWLAAKNRHIEVVKYLKDMYNPNWKDKDNFSLEQRIYNNNHIIVLKSFLVSNVVDGGSYKDIYSNYSLKIPLSKAIENQYPSDIIKLLLKKSNFEVINKMKDSLNSQVSVAHRIIINLLKYDNEIVTLVVNSGINFSGVLNLMLFEYNNASFYGPINMVKYNNSLSFFSSDTHFSDLPNFIKKILKSGVGFNTKDNVTNQSTMQCSRQAYYINKLLNNLTTIETPKETLFKLILECVLTIEGHININSFRRHKKNCQILLLHGGKSDNLTLIPDWLHKQLTELNSKSYSEISSHLYNLRYYINNANREINHFKKYPDSTLYNNILIGYEEMLEFHFASESHKTEKYKTLLNIEITLFSRILKLYIRQDYNITAAFKDVAAEVLKVKALLTWIKRKVESQETTITAEELLKILYPEDITVNEKLRTIAIKIYECGGFSTLCEIWSSLSEIGHKNMSEVLKSMTKYRSSSKEIYNLLNNLDKSYRDLIVAIRLRDFMKIEEILQNVESNYKKAIINGQDDEYGSPLHYVVCNGDLELTRLLLSHGANPNDKLEDHGVLLSQPTNADEESDEDGTLQSYKGYTPLHIAVTRGHIHIVQLLLSYQANCNILNNEGYNSFQLAEEKLHVYKKIIHILKSESSSQLTCNVTDYECAPGPSK